MIPGRARAGACADAWRSAASDVTLDVSGAARRSDVGVLGDTRLMAAAVDDVRIAVEAR